MGNSGNTNGAQLHFNVVNRRRLEEAGHYANRVEVLLRVLHAASVSESHKEDYLALLRAQLSDQELVVLKAYSKTHVGDSLRLAIDDFKGLANAGFLLKHPSDFDSIDRGRDGETRRLPLSRS